MSLNFSSRARAPLLWLALAPVAAPALSTGQTLAMSIGDSDQRIAAITQAAASGDAQVPAFLQALLDGAVKVSPGRASSCATARQSALPALSPPFCRSMPKT